MNFKLDTIRKLRTVLWILGISIGIVEYIMVNQYLTNLSAINLLNILGVILSLVLPLLFGYYYNEYHNQKTAINELYKIIIELWENAKEMESKANNENYFKKNEIFNYEVFFEAKCLQKEVSILYILGFYFNNVKWYNHQLYNLPINFKQKISELCKTNLEIDDTIVKYSTISIEEFIRHHLLPIQYGYYNTNPILKEFFEFLILNSDKNYSDYVEILTELNKVKIEKINLNGEYYYF